MRKIRVVYFFPGQGSQYPGMARSLIDQGGPSSDMAVRITSDLYQSGYPSDIIADMQSDRVDRPLQTQVAVYVHSTLAWVAFNTMIREGGTEIEPVATAGHSAGELAALVAAGAIDSSTMARVVYERAKIMDQAPAGSLVNVELHLNSVISLIDAFHKESRNVRVYVSLSQGSSLTAVGGLIGAIDAFCEFLVACRVNHRRVIGVAKPLHTPEQSNIRGYFRAALEHFSFQHMHISVLSNSHGEPYNQSEIKDTLASQLDSQVRFADVVEYIKNMHPERYLLFGPAEKLAELLSVYNGVDARLIRVINTASDLREVVSELNALSASYSPRWLKTELVEQVQSVLGNDGEDSHVVLDPLGRVRRVADVLEDRTGIIICKGSFNPIHNLHVALLRSVRNEHRSSVAMFALSSHTDKGELSATELARRIRLIHLAGFPVLLSRTGYFYENFAYFQRWLPKQKARGTHIDSCKNKGLR